MSAQHLLLSIRTSWLHRVAHSTARGAEVRANFEKELEQFFTLLEQAVATGDPAWMDSILSDWASSPTQSDLEQGKNNVSLLLSKMIGMTNEVARENLKEHQALDLLTELTPIFIYLLDKGARLEMDTRVAYMSRELVRVQQQLEKLDKSKSNFISVAAHELKTPLTLIEGYTTMMRDMIDAVRAEPVRRVVGRHEQRRQPPARDHQRHDRCIADRQQSAFAQLPTGDAYAHFEPAQG
jgi:signal transduction histidine kinase